MKQRILIVGLGLIGASMSLCIKKQHPQTVLIGWDKLETTRNIAKEKKIVDLIPADFAEGATQADLILLAVPVNAARNFLDQLEQLPVKENLLVTDVSSTKQQIVHAAQTKKFRFVGGHPMAGSHKSGVQAADSDLFENAYYIFTPVKEQSSDVALLQELFQGTRAKYVVLSAEEHDRITGMLSHLPHIIAAGLVNQADLFNQEHPRAKQLAAGGFRDITRIASSDPVMWTDILLSNKKFLLEGLTQWQQEMEQIAGWLKEDNQQEIFAFFNRAKDTRDQLPVHQHGAIPAFYDLLIDVPDVPGVIAEVTGLLGAAKLSLINLKIQETREDIIGVLQISFKNQKDLLAAQKCIETNTDYHCWTK
ncbi:prephenate dehydrogenase [Enterococcus sp. JM9B]|uniref:prephenate dehydrogenase n=1 Tax=Enterococcus sp. JM9B TaxID=1857216 RepID=UPI001374EE49|nr:prephenate dehydrogenase [Enterococcus sp. JM9B]KAF1302511.1 prephenate dehydrogenase [Enterococcus sp. JM9B]